MHVDYHECILVPCQTWFHEILSMCIVQKFLCPRLHMLPHHGIEWYGKVIHWFYHILNNQSVFDIGSLFFHFLTYTAKSSAVFTQSSIESFWKYCITLTFEFPINQSAASIWELVFLFPSWSDCLLLHVVVTKGFDQWSWIFLCSNHQRDSDFTICGCQCTIMQHSKPAYPYWNSSKLDVKGLYNVFVYPDGPWYVGRSVSVESLT